MAAPIISIFILVILVVPSKVPIAPADSFVASEVGAVFVISPTGVLDLVDYSSSSDSDPSEDSLPVAPELPLVSPFLCSDDLEVDSESEPSEQRPERHESLIPSFEFPLAPVVAPPRIHRWPAILVRPGEAIPFGRPYRTHPSGPRKLLTARKRFGPFPARRLAWRRIFHHSSDRHSSPDFTSDSSSSLTLDSSSDISSGSSSDSYPNSSSIYSSGCDASESSLGSYSKRSLDSSSPSARPSRKRCRSPATLVPSSTPVLRLIAPALADLPPQTIADLGISEGVGAYTEDGIDMGVEVAIREDEEEFEAKASAGGTMEIVVDPLVTSCISEPTGGDVPDLEGTLYDISHYMYEVPLDTITEFETAQRQLKAGQLVASGERAGLADRVRSLGLENLMVHALLCIKRDHVESLRHHMSLSQEEFCQVRRDRDDTRRRLKRTMTNTRSRMTPAAIEEMSNRRVTEALETRKANRKIELGNGNDEGGNGKGNGNGNGGGNGNGNHNENDRDARPVVRECTYQDFMKCQPLNFKGTEGVIGLIRWFEKMETVFHISNYPEKYQVKYATCTLLNSALTWWNSHKRTIGTNTAFSMSWRELM
ncbi:hypothetical protein Tco_0885922 [Tanacetum coccineum]